MIETLNQWLSPIKSFISPWVYAPVLFVLWLLVLNGVRTIFFIRVKNFAKNSPFPISGILVEATRFPAALLILGSGIWILGLFLPMELKVQKAMLLLTQATVILSIILFLDRWIKEFVMLFSDRVEFAFISKGLLCGIIRGTILGLGLLIFLDLIGISITPILASLGIGSLAVALALQDTLANFFAGIYITLDQPVREGDFVKLESGEEGYVKEVGWRSTKIQLLPDKVVIVPNQKLISSIVTNFYMPTREFSVVIPIGVHHDSDLRKVEEITIDIAKQVIKTVPSTVQNFEPIIRYTAFAESSINFNVVLHAREISDQHLIKHEFIKALHERYKKEGIVIPYPTQTLDIPAETFEKLRNH